MKKKILSIIMAATISTTVLTTTVLSVSAVDYSSATTSNLADSNVPAFNSIENLDGSVKLSWNAMPDVAKYRVYYKGRNGWTKFAETTGTSAVDSVVKNGETYTYTIRGLDKNNNFVTDFNRDGWRHTYLSVPNFTDIENIDGAVKLSWNAVPTASKYRVYYRGRNGWTKFAETSDTTAFDSVVKSGETYTYTIRALDEFDNFITYFNTNGWRHTYADVPQFTNIESLDNAVKLSWNAVPGVAKYRVYYKGRNGWTKFAETAGTKAVDSVVKSGETYTYTIRGLDSNGKFITDCNTNGWKHTYADIPTFSEIENLDGSVKLSWNAVPGADKYRVYYRGRNGWTKFAETAGTVAYDADVKSDETYTYTIRALNNDGQFVSYCNSAGWRHKYVATPKITGFENTKSGVVIRWNRVEGAAQYRVFVMTNDGWQRLGTSKTTTFTDTTATTSKTYTYTVRAMDENGNYVSSYNHNGWEHYYVLWHEAVYKDVYHPAEMGQVWVVDVEGHPVEEPIYEYHEVCKGCGAFLDEMDRDEIAPHLVTHILAGESGGYYFGNVQVGTRTIIVGEEGHYETVVIKEAWVEKVLVREAGYY